jgi:hypothetical protein
MAQTPIDPPDIAPPVEAPSGYAPSAATVLPIPGPSPAPRTRGGLLAWAIYGLAVANVLTLWVVRDVFVNGWDLFGQTYGVLLLNQGSFTHALSTIWESVLSQRQRPVFTGGESFIYGLIPGLLSGVAPWLLWSHFVNLVLFVLVSSWIVRRLRVAPWVYWACVLASPALVSLSITGLPDLPSTAIPYGLTVAYLLSDRQRERSIVWGTLVDLAFFATVAFIAFNGYESGKTFFVVPVIAAVTLPRIPLMRRLVWIACAAVIGWLVHGNQAATTQTALAAVPRDVAGFMHGLLAFGREYFVTWYIDFPALALAAFASLLVLREKRLFWTTLLFAAVGLVTLNAFQFDGGFLVPHRYLLLGFLSVLVVSSALSQVPRPRGAVLLWVLLAAGIGYTTLTTVRFAREQPPATAENWNITRVYPLPYNRARLDAHIWRDRIADAKTLVQLIKQGDEQHVVFYGFSAAGEDSVNPQLIVSRFLLPLGYGEFNRRVTFFDNSFHMYFPFPVQPLADVRPKLATLHTPFFVHVREPEQSAASVLAKYLNRATVTPVDLGLHSFVSYRVDAYAPPGPTPVRPLDAAAAAAAARALPTYADGFCVTSWYQDAGEHSPLRHEEGTLSQSIDRILSEANKGGSPRYLNVTRKFTKDAAEVFDRSAVAYIVGWMNNPEDHPIRVLLQVAADDEVGMTVNDQSVLETLGWRSTASYAGQVLLPPGPNQVKIVYHKYWHNGGVAFSSIDEKGHPVAWQCDPGFH